LNLLSLKNRTASALSLDWAISIGLGTLTYLFWGFSALAQVPTPPPVGDPQIEQTIPTPPTPIPVQPPAPLPVPELETTPEAPPTEIAPPNVIRFPLAQIEILGSPILHPVLQNGIPQDNQTAQAAIAQLKQQSTCDLITPSFEALTQSQSEVEKLSVSLTNCEATFDDLIRLRTAITLLYTSNGYVTSGAFVLPNPNLDQQVAQVQVVEGELEDISVCMLSSDRFRRRPSVVTSEDPSASQPECGSATLQSSYVRSRLNLANSTPLDQDKLRQALQLLQLDPLVEQVNAELTAGSSPGQSVLQVDVREAFPFRLAVSVDNYQSPSIGSNQAAVEASYSNIIGIGDRISAQYGITEGLDLYDFSYGIPVNARNGTITLRYSNNDSNITTEEFQDLGIRSTARTYSVNFRQPLVRTPESEFALGVGFDVRQSRSYILDDRPFQFSEGAEDGKAKVSVLRFSQEWVNRNPTRVLAARSQFSFGLDAFDATVNDSGTDGTFFAWLGQFQYVQQITPTRMFLVTRLNAQLTPDSLLSLERFSFGGVDSVRGYAQNQVVADNGVFSAVELRIPLTDNPNRLQIIPFLEAGYAWNNKTADPIDDFIAGVGLGVNWQPLRDLNIRLDYGIPLINVDGQGDSLQESGIYFSVRYQPL
jgi:hemolysin activation/secretion protein